MLMWSLVILAGEKLIGVRDPRGFRPLWLGRRGDAHLLASETCGLDIVGADPIREVEPGEMVVSEGSFTLKSELLRSRMGHGHAH